MTLFPEWFTEPAFPPHGPCLLPGPLPGPEPWALWLNVTADGVIALVCLLGFGTFLRLFRWRRGAPQSWQLVTGSFLLAFGLTHAVQAWHAWRAWTALDGLAAGTGLSGALHALGAVKAGAAMAGLAALGVLLGLAPRLLEAPAPPGEQPPDPPGPARPEAQDAALAAAEAAKRQALERLEDLESRFRLFIDGVKEYAIFRLDPEGRVATWNRGAERIFGYGPEEIIGQGLARFHDPEDPGRDRTAQALEQARAGGHFEEEGWLVRKDGSRFYALAHITAIWNGCGRLLGYAKVTRDISERRETEIRIQNLAQDLADKVRAQDRELLESGAMIRGIIQYAPAAIALKDLAGQFLVVNPRMETLIGRPQSEIIGRRYGDLFPQEVNARLAEREQRVLGLRQAVEGEEQWTHADGSVHDYLYHVFPLVDALGHCWGVGSLSTDITERKQADLAMLQSQKMESLGLLAGGVAHDFNNLLGAIQGNLELAKLELPPGAPVPEHLQVLEGLTGNASYLVGQILTYCGRGPFQLEPLDLNRAVEEMIHLMRASISRKAVIRYDPDPQQLVIQGDASQIQQLVMNLVMNASEALEDRDGSITIRTGMERLSAAYIRSVYEGQGVAPGPHASLEVSDTGVGMTQAVRERIFDPFFTTKFTGRGLGLSAILGIVRAHRGGIRVYSEPGKGTQFKVVLPALDEAVPALAPVADDALETFRGTGTVLVVEDEASLRAAAVKLLNHAGFDTLQAVDGVEALRMLEQHRDRIRLILMDLTMPRMGGEEAYRELRQRGIRIPVILSSGFHESEALRRFRGQGLAGFLQKPYRYNVLMKMLRETLEP
jgi:PAS domain S-box-containing protein